MSDIKSVLTLLCQHLNLSIGTNLKPEYFRSAKFNTSSEQVSASLWQTLDILGSHVVTEKQADVDFRKYDTPSAIKLCFAYLQYPVIEFYGTSDKTINNRELLLALAWLLGTQDILSTVVRAKLATTILGRECLFSNIAQKTEVTNEASESFINQMHNILHLYAKVNYNIKEVSELTSEKVKLVAKVHAASMNVSGLPHLSVSELALSKRHWIKNQMHSDVEKKQMQELSNMGHLLETHMKLTKKEHVFYDWMVTVIEERNKSVASNLDTMDWEELLKFIVLLRWVIKDRLQDISLRGVGSASRDETRCVSRFLRAQDGDTETGNWLAKAMARLTQEKEDLRKKKEQLTEELKRILQLIPASFQI